ncbi:iron-sulfur cluster assembly accessory protein [Allomyces macrogynus ATCC 38327]|uniref:Iron-sulfur cluster assembly accessory protein n=1 Tax=Allomyces macrogynus (strain ATCC 38327) TaxID=578462 RepID=A0A0L0TCF3_ALLM3|nr:iron-sulfur cluster assembly accessory protein [Allomyces macrogynus ATCC 38327]|eukprot:KNE72390.1 iron-sulfur cluster assembly accessory protein [Allomyces macrogynus ATCC 38327]
MLAARPILQSAARSGAPRTRLSHRLTVMARFLATTAAPARRALASPFFARLPSPHALAPRPWPVLGRSYSTVATRIVAPNPPPVNDQGMPLVLLIDESAVQQLRKIYERDGNDQQALRITVDAGGCHGFEYKLDLVDLKSQTTDDVHFDAQGAKVLVDDVSLGLISGSRLVFTDELIGRAFKLVDNPNAGSSCGCGTSFEVKM